MQVIVKQHIYINDRMHKVHLKKHIEIPGWDL